VSFNEDIVKRAMACSFFTTAAARLVEQDRFYLLFPDAMLDG